MYITKSRNTQSSVKECYALITHNYFENTNLIQFSMCRNCRCKSLYLSLSLSLSQPQLSCTDFSYYFKQQEHAGSGMNEKASEEEYYVDKCDVAESDTSSSHPQPLPKVSSTT